MSYRTTPNFKQIISSHNAKIMKGGNFDPPCNCQKKDSCPLNGKCRVKNLIYQATITTHQNPPQTETYVGMTSTEFKDRHRNHKKSFNHYTYKAETTLSQHIWRLKSKNIEFDEEWKILDRARPLSPVTGVCSLCTLEKFYIISYPEEATLNKNEEIYKPCIHRKLFLLDKT